MAKESKQVMNLQDMGQVPVLLSQSNCKALLKKIRVEPQIVILDCGNSAGKGIVSNWLKYGLNVTGNNSGHKAVPAHITNAQATTQAEDFYIDELKQDIPSVPGYWDRFKYTDSNNQTHYVIVGEAATFKSNCVSLNGVAKYISSHGAPNGLGYIEAYVIAMLAILFPEGHDNIQLNLAMPIGDRKILDNAKNETRILKNHFNGRVLRAEFPDRKVLEWNITSFKSFDEPLGSLSAIMFVEENRIIRNANVLPPNQIIAVVDVGGGITHFAVTQTGSGNGFSWLNADDSTLSYPEGVLDITHKLDSALRSNFVQELRDWRKLPRPMLLNALQKRTIQVHGNTLDVGQFVSPHVNRFFNDIRGQLVQVITKYQVDAIAWTGGGADFLETQIAEFNRTLDIGRQIIVGQKGYRAYNNSYGMMLLALVSGGKK